MKFRCAFGVGGCKNRLSMSQKETDPMAAPAAPWVRYSPGEGEEDFIVGSPAGLQKLRDHIDKAIVEGESTIPDAQIGFNGVRCRLSPEDEPVDSGSSLAAWGCLLLLGSILFLALYGGWTLIERAS